MDTEYVRSRFIKHFDGTTGFLYASPGRINLIGEHTDYNGGFVFPGAVDKGMIAEIKPNGTDKVRAYSIDLKDYVEFGLNEEDAPRASWARYIFGVCREMIKRGVDVKGFNTAFAGDVPLGAVINCFSLSKFSVGNDVRIILIEHFTFTGSLSSDNIYRSIPISQSNPNDASIIFIL